MLLLPSHSYISVFNDHLVEQRCVSEIDSVCARVKMNSVLPDRVYSLLKNIVNKNLDNYTISVHDPNKKGEGFLGEMCYVSIEDKATGKVLSFVIKQAFQEEKLRNAHFIRLYYLNEIHFYSKVWPALDKFQRGLPLKKIFDKIPKCFGTSSNNGDERIVLENLKKQGFQTHEKKKPLDREHYEFIFKEYGRFHAISFAYKILHPEEYQEISKDLTVDFRVVLRIKSFKRYLRYLHEIASKTLHPEEDRKALEKYKLYIENGLELFESSCNYRGKYSAILHGDCWSNNMMFKYDESNKLSDMRLLDFQFSNVGTPVCDLSYCLYSGATKEIIDDLDHFLKLYYDSLSRTLEEFGLDSCDVYPFEELKNDWRLHCSMGYTMSLMIWRIKFTREDEVRDLKDTKDTEQGLPEGLFTSKFDEEKFNVIVRDLILHLYENNSL